MADESQGGLDEASFQISPSMAIIVRSAIPGRVRWDVSALLDRPSLVPVINQVLLSCPGVKSVASNPVTGRVLVHYDPVLVRLEDLQVVLERVILQHTLDIALTPVASTETTQPPGGHRTELSVVNVLVRTPEHKQLAIRSIGMGFLDHLFSNITPALIGVGVDIVTRGPGSIFGKLGFRTIRSQLLLLAGIGTGVWSLDSLLAYLRSRSYSDLANAIRDDLRNEVYQHLQSLDIARIEEEPVTEWIGILDSDINQIAGYINSGVDPIIGMVTNGLFVAGSFIVLSPALAAAQLLTIPGVFLVSTGLLKMIRERQTQVRKDEATLDAILHDNLTGIATIASFSQQETEATRIKNAGAELLASLSRSESVSAAYVPAIQMAVGPSFLTTLVYGGVLVSRNQLTPGAYNVMGYSTMRLLAALGRLGVSIEQYQRTKVSLRRVVSVLESRPRISDGERSLDPDSVVGEISFVDVVFGYNPDQPVLKNVRLRFPAGKTTGVVGPSGAGKTTLLKLLLRFYDVDSGSVQLDGIDVRDFRINDLRRSMALVPQAIFLFTGTIRENILYGRPDATDDEVELAARIAEAHEFIVAMPRGYDTLIGEGHARLSGGQQQRIGIARAVLANRPILLFDEATSAVDYETEAAIQRSLREFTAGRTTVIIAHRLSTIRHAEVIYVLDEGQVREQGRHEDLIRAGGIYASMWNVQTGEVRQP